MEARNDVRGVRVTRDFGGKAMVPPKLASNEAGSATEIDYTLDVFLITYEVARGA
jgi:hypothetical protein